MFINQSLGQHTLLLFSHEGVSSSLLEPQQGDQTIQQESLASQQAPAVFSDTTTDAEREMAAQMELYADAAQRAALVAATEQRVAAAAEFQHENGYKNRLTEGLYSAHGLAQQQQPGQAYFETRADAVDELSNRLSDINSALLQYNRAREGVAVPRLAEGRDDTDYLWSRAAPDVAEPQLAKLSAEEQTMAAEKQRHDLKVTEMKLDIAVAELARDFGISVDLSISEDGESSMKLADFEVTSGKYGSLPHSPAQGHAPLRNSGTL